MKKILFFFLLISIKISYSQKGKIYLKNSEITPGVENVYIYEPPKGLLVPEKTIVRVLYDFSGPSSIPLIKKEGGYEFSLKLPGSLSFVIFVIADSKNKSIDNNHEKGFVVYLKSKTNGQLNSAKLDKLKLSEYANYALDLNITTDEILSGMDKLFKQDPALKRDHSSYVYYLQLKYRKYNDAAKPELIRYAGFLGKKNDEKDLSLAKDLYSLLKMDNTAAQVKGLILEKYPKGEFARNNFLNEVYNYKNPDEQYFLERLSTYEKKFNDSTADTRDRFYRFLVIFFLNKKDLANTDKYESLITDKMNVAGLYNNTAWGLSGGNLTSPGADLEFAAQISKKSVDIVKERMDDPRGNTNPADIQSAYIGYVDTYALIMFKEKKYDSAYLYQDEIYKLDTMGMGTDGRERYAAYMEKVKGLEFTKEFIERQLEEGQNSALMVGQLQEIYKKLNLPESEFEKIKSASSALARKDLKAEAVAKYGDIQAIDFSLSNLEGRNIKLSDYRGKVVVLDFWATWCGPCRASFPGMLELVNQYKNKDVAFFFVDVWQDGNPGKIKNEVSKFIRENKYPFNVLFDYNNDIVTKYKIRGIPTKIVIDKRGDFLSVNSSEDNLKALIDESIK